jgi:peptidyl-prolyl cis-trans isomerase A (cyclophilin A)
MIKKHLSILALSLTTLSLVVGCQSGPERSMTTETSTATKETAPKEEKKGAEDTFKGVKVYAIIDTNMGTIKAELFPDKAPKAVENFVALAEGKKKWIHPITGPKIKKPFYDGMTFHRVIPGSLIQGGDPLGTGQGNPGVEYEQEIVPGLKFDKPGLLGMVNFGANTNGTQFFITLSPQKQLDGKYTIFGQVVEGLNAASKIANVPHEPQTYRPLKPVYMRKVTIERVPINQSSKPS